MGVLFVGWGPRPWGPNSAATCSALVPAGPFNSSSQPGQVRRCVARCGAVRLRAAAGRSVRAARGTAEPAPGWPPASLPPAARRRRSAGARGHPGTWRPRVPSGKGKSVSGRGAARAASPARAAARGGTAGHRAAQPAARQAPAETQPGDRGWRPAEGEGTERARDPWAAHGAGGGRSEALAGDGKCS